MSQAKMLDTKSIFGVDGIVAVVTGGGTGLHAPVSSTHLSLDASYSERLTDHQTGIGWNMAEALAVNGARKVYILGRRPDVIKQAAAKYPDIMVSIVCDVASKESLQSAVDQISKETGYVNLLIRQQRHRRAEEQLRPLPVGVGAAHEASQPIHGRLHPDARRERHRGVVHNGQLP